MVKFTNEQGCAYAAIQNLINAWARELDQNNGARVGDFLTEDCVYAVGPTPRQGRSEVETFYRERLERLQGTPEGPPTNRHMNANICVDFRSADEAAVTFSMIFFSTMYAATPDALATADVRMVMRAKDGDWKIANFESNQPFKRG